MAVIVYSRNQFLPEVLYLPLSYGGYIQLQEGAHVYPEHAAFSLKNSENPIIKNYIRSGTVVINLDANSDVLVTDTNTRKFAPLDMSVSQVSGNFASMSGSYQSEPLEENTDTTSFDTLVSTEFVPTATTSDEITQKQSKRKGAK